MDTIHKLVKNNYQIFLFIFCTGLIANSYELTHGLMTPDEELAWDTATKFLSWNASLGRWSFYIYKQFILPDLQFPIISCIYSIFALSLACTLWFNYKSNMPFTAKALAGSLIVACPVFGHMLTFSFMCAQVCFSALFIVCAYLVMAYLRNCLIHNIIALGLITFSILTYQSLIFIPFSLFLIDGFDNIFSKKSIKLFFRLMAISIMAIILYYMANIVLKRFYETMRTDYLVTHIGWLQYPFWQSIDQLKYHINEIIHGRNYTFLPIRLGVFPIMILLFVKFKFEKLVSLLLIIAFSIFAYLIFGSIVPSRSLFYIPFLFGGLFLLAYNSLSQKKYRCLLLCIGWYVFCLSSSINTNFSMLDYFARQKDEIIAIYIVNQIYNRYPDYMINAKTVVIMGTINEPPDKQYYPKLRPILRKDGAEVFGQSYFNYKDGDEGRIIHFMRWLGVEMPWFDLPSKKEKIAMMDEFKRMPSYPENGFIKIIDKTLVIKLSG